MRTMILTCTFLALAALLAPPATGQQGGGEKVEKNKPYRVGYKIQDLIELSDLSGKTRDIFGENDEKVIVLVFWSLRDPRCRKTETKLAELDAAYAARGVVFLLVDSNHDEIVAGLGDPLEKLRKFKRKSKLPFEILIDKDNKLADDCKALTASHVFVIGADRYLRYQGGIDNDPKGLLKDEARIDWLKDGIDAALSGKNAQNALTRPKGRKIRRKPKTAK